MSKKYQNTNIKQRANWELVISLVTIVFITLGSNISLYIHSSSQMDRQMSGIREEISAIHQEMKDFHGRLCAIEERNKKEKY